MYDMGTSFGYHKDNDAEFRITAPFHYNHHHAYELLGRCRTDSSEREKYIYV